MYVSRLALDRFRSWEHLVVDLTPGVNILQGANGLGKTNIVEALEVLSTGSSHRASSSLPLIERGSTSATIRANVAASPAHPGAAQGGPAAGDPADSAASSGPTELPEPQEDAVAEPAASDTTTYELTVTARGANRARINGGRSTYMRDVIGRIPSVSFTPEDQRLIAGDPASRRTLLNQAGTLLIAGYAQRLQTMTKIARQRAALLKQLADARRSGFGGLPADEPNGIPSPADAALNGLEIWTGQFIETGVALTRDRQRLVSMLASPFTDIYRELTRDDGTATIEYQPSFDEVLLYPDAPQARISEHFQRIYPGEVARGQNLIGPHRDDLDIMLDGMPAREFASNGEMWTMALALKMALYRVLAAERGERPIVILDDVFAQLDDTRRRQILDFAARQDQVLVTVAAAGDVPDMDGRLAAAAHIIDVAELKRRQDLYLHPDPAMFAIEAHA